MQWKDYHKLSGMQHTFTQTKRLSSPLVTQAWWACSVYGQRQNGCRGNPIRQPVGIIRVG